jgi:hypothetical protein
MKKGVSGNPKGRPTLEMQRHERADWLLMKEEWMESHLQKKPMNFRQLAEKHKVSWAVVRNKASKGKWVEELEKRLSAFDLEVAERMKRAATAVTEQLQEDFIGNELEIRRRHAKVARGIQGKALQRISTAEISEMRVSDAIALLKLGMDEERRAMGMPDNYTAPSASGKLHPEYKNIAEQTAEHGSIAKKAGQFLLALKKATEESADLKDLVTEGLRDITPTAAENAEMEGK